MFVFSFLLWNLSLRKLGCLLVWTSSELLFPRTILKDTNEKCCFNTLSNIQREKTWFIKELWFNLNFCHCSWQCITLVEKNQHLSEMMSWNKSVEQFIEIKMLLTVFLKSYANQNIYSNSSIKTNQQRVWRTVQKRNW